MAFTTWKRFFFPVPITDALEVVQKNGATNLAVTGLPIDAHAEDNICMKAYRLMQHQFPHLPSVSIHLHKAIPSGAGLGGGSADGAFMLKLLNQKFALGLKAAELIQLALELGSDCPFFIHNQPCYATGRGEKMKPVEVNLSGYSLVLVCPRIHVATGWAFAQLAPGRVHFNIEKAATGPVEAWKNELVNDFETPVFKAYPEIGKIKEDLYQAGAVYAAMSGSGSTVFGIFKGAATPLLSFPENYFVYRF